MSKQSLTISFLVLVLVLGGVVWYSKKDVLKGVSVDEKPVVETPVNNKPPVSVTDNKTISVPVALNNPNVGSARIHYFMFGRVVSVNKVGEGYELVLKDATGLPSILIKKGVRISRITPPYESNLPVYLTVNDLKVGLYVDISLEYEINSKEWMIHDIFIPTDKNK